MSHILISSVLVIQVNPLAVKMLVQVILSVLSTFVQVKPSVLKIFENLVSKETNFKVFFEKVLQIFAYIFFVPVIR